MNAYGTRYPDLFAALAAPFEPQDVKVRSQAARQLHYITARTVMNRLDDVLGPENWWDEYIPNENSVLCRLTLRLPDGSTLTKADAGGYAGMADSGDDDKSGYSDAFKRAAVKFGVARYLYRDGVPDFARNGAAVPQSPAPPAQPADLGWVHNAPAGDGNGRPRRDWPAAAAAPAPAPTPPRPGTAPVRHRPPDSGKRLFGWVKDMEQRHEVGLLKYLNQWGKLQDFPGRMVDWDAHQVSLAYDESRRKLAAVESQEPEPAGVTS